jgi:hypothetical protein
MRLPRIRHGTLAQVAELAPCKLDAPRSALGARRQQVHDGERGQRLAAARLSHNTERLTTIDVERHTLHSPQSARRHGQLDVQILHREHALVHLHLAADPNST